MELDWFSYRCGVIDCFNEMVRAGLKPMALAHPCSTPAERDQYLPFCGGPTTSSSTGTRLSAGPMRR